MMDFSTFYSEINIVQGELMKGKDVIKSARGKS